MTGWDTLEEDGRGATMWNSFGNRPSVAERDLGSRSRLPLSIPYKMLQVRTLKSKENILTVEYSQV
jgi:hypothetical protein